MTPGRPATFTADDAVRAALDLGIAAFTMPRVATVLGVTAPALYRVFPSRADLTAAGLVAIGEEQEPVPDGLSWRGILTVLADRLWTALHRHPGLGEVMATFPRSLGDALDPGHRMTRGLADQGFTPSQILFATQYIADLMTVGADQTDRQLREFTAHAGSPTARTFRTPDNRVVTDAEDLRDGGRRQCMVYVGVFLDALGDLAPDFPEMAGPVAVPAPDQGRRR